MDEKIFKNYLDMARLKSYYVRAFSIIIRRDEHMRIQVMGKFFLPGGGNRVFESKSGAMCTKPDCQINSANYPQG